MNLDRRGNLKRYHLKEERSMREIAASKSAEQEDKRSVFNNKWNTGEMKSLPSVMTSEKVL